MTFFLKNTLSWYLIQVGCFLFSFIGSNAQTYNLLPQEKKQALRLHSQIVIRAQDFGNATIKELLESNLPIAVEYLQKNDLRLIEKILEQQDSLVVITNKKDSVFTKNPAIIAIKSNQIETLILNSSKEKDSTKLRFSGLEELGRIHFANNKVISDSLVYTIWRNSGKIPNFIDADSSSYQTAGKVVSMLNSKRKVFGVVKTPKGLLKNVSFKNFKEKKINGYFSFPRNLRGRKPILIPYKAGYYFSPDIIYTTLENEGNPKEFMGYPLDIDFGLTDHFVFEKTVSNRIRNNEREILSKRVKSTKESMLGNVGFFEKRAYIDAGIQSRSALKSSFTITAWVKPTSLGFANSILGKGKNFVLKIHKGYLTFTMAEIKDYISFASPISLNKWTHIALVYSEIYNELYFYVNGKHTDTVQLISSYTTSNHNLLIGNNLWEEFFNGYLGDIKIWERELNNTEIEFQYHDVKSKNYALFFIFGGTSILLGVVLFFGIKGYKKRKSRIKIAFSKTKKRKSNTPLPANYKEYLFCFGSLQLITANEIDIATKLSPKLKQLFLVIFLHSIDQKKGISTKRLTEILWPGMTPQGAKNNRGTNIQNLKNILSFSSEIKLVFLEKHWFLQIGNNCFCDYIMARDYMQLFDKEEYQLPLLEQKLAPLLSLLKRGRLFSYSSQAWLDPYIEKFSSLIIKECFNYAYVLSIEKQSELLLDCIEIIHIYDDLNEKSLRLKLQIFIHQGKLSLARTLYDNFIKLYQEIYKETYPISFEKSISREI